MDSPNLPTELLRTFITVIDLGGYTKAGAVIGRTQPAVSLQMRRLEEMLDAKLIHQVGRTLQLTEQGEMLAVYARRILCLNDEAVARFRRQMTVGVLRIGLPTDYAVAFLQGMMTEYAVHHPEVELEIRCELSRELLDDLQKDELDIVIAMTGEGVGQYLAREWVEQPIWATAGHVSVHKESPVPIVVHPEGCEYRNRITQALNAANRDWRVAYCSPGISGLQNAVLAGLGVSALTKRTLLDGMKVLSEKDGFPTLADIRVGLYYKHPRQSDAGVRLVNHIISGLDGAGGPEFKRPHRR
ncbi:MAG: LysR substrate-binding domain-containing protein [bacterium]|nr:LysR substrate-binding domain-containing protein [bacterium]